MSFVFSEQDSTPYSSGWYVVVSLSSDTGLELESLIITFRGRAGFFRQLLLDDVMEAFGGGLGLSSSDSGVGSIRLLFLGKIFGYLIGVCTNFQEF